MRPQDWPERLALFQQEKQSLPFVWGENDCCLFSADWVAMLTEIDPAETLGLRGAYRTALEAARILKERGGVEAIATQMLGEPVAVGLARRGDLVTTETEGATTVGVCFGAQAGFVGRTGLIYYPLTSCRKAWRVG